MKKDKRCEVCGGELSYCGEMTADGPSLDCLACGLRNHIRTLEAELTQAREDARVLAAEVRAWRADKEGDISCHAKLFVSYDDSVEFGPINQVGMIVKKAKTDTDASGALERNKP